MDPFAPATLGQLTLRNRFIKAATFEGRTPRGKVTDALIEFHRRTAAGGVGMSTVAYCAVSREGTTDGHQIVMHPDAIPDLRRLTDAIHQEGAAAAAQIGHAGPVANPAGTKHAAVSASRTFSPLGMRRTTEATVDALERVGRDFVQATEVAVASGFDAIEVHLGHNYLLSSFLSPRLNRRDDAYGGSLENRARFPRHVLRLVRNIAGNRAAVTAKFNMTDGVRGGLQLEDALQVATWIQQDATVDALELTGGSSFRNPMFLFKGDAPVKEMAAVMPWYLGFGIRLVGRRFFRSYPFEEAYFLPMARTFREALRLPLIYLGGVNRLDTVKHVLDEGFDFVAMGRALLMEPDLVNRWSADPAAEGSCIHCNKCMPTIYSGTRCVLTAPPPELAGAGN